MACSTASVPEFQKKNVSNDGSYRISDENNNHWHVLQTWHHRKQFLDKLEVWDMESNCALS